MMKRSVTDWRLGGLMEEMHVEGVRLADYLVLFIFFWLILFMSIRMEKANVDNPGELVSKHGKVFQWIMIYGLILLIIVFGIYGPGYDPAEFVYMQF